MYSRSSLAKYVTASVGVSQYRMLKLKRYPALPKVNPSSRIQHDATDRTARDICALSPEKNQLL